MTKHISTFKEHEKDCDFCKGMAEIHRARNVSKNNNEISITVDISAVKELFELLDIKNPICVSCKKKITPDNFGGMSKDYIFCNNFVCLLDVVNTYKKDG